MQADLLGLCLFLQSALHMDIKCCMLGQDGGIRISQDVKK